MIDLSLRGEMEPGYFIQFTLTFNPWSDKWWGKARFFDKPDDRTLALTTTYRCNEWLSEADRKQFEQLPPRRRRVEADGEWGISEGLIYSNWEIREFDVNRIKKDPYALSAFGLDFGYTLDPTAFSAMIILPQVREIYVFDEFYERGLSNRQIADLIKYRGYAKERIIADSQEPKSIDEIRSHGIGGIRACEKGPGSLMHGIQLLQDYRIIVHPKCTNTEIELSNYSHKKDKNGGYLNEPADEFNHMLDGIRYGVVDMLSRQKTKKSRNYGSSKSCSDFGSWEKSINDMKGLH